MRKFFCGSVVSFDFASMISFAFTVVFFDFGCFALPRDEIIS